MPLLAISEKIELTFPERSGLALHLLHGCEPWTLLTQRQEIREQVPENVQTTDCTKHIMVGVSLSALATWPGMASSSRFVFRGSRVANWLTNAKEWTGRPVQDLLTITQSRQMWRTCSNDELTIPEKNINILAQSSEAGKTRASHELNKTIPQPMRRNRLVFTRQHNTYFPASYGQSFSKNTARAGNNIK